MAGTCKPTKSNLGSECSYKVLSLLGSQGSGGTVDNCGLFDGQAVDEWNTDRVFYWYNNTDFLEIEIDGQCNIWRTGTNSYNGYNSALYIYKYNESTSTYEDITDSITQNLSVIGNTVWEEWIHGLPKGRYKFVGGKGLRIDSEWYIECTHIWDLDTAGTNVSVDSSDNSIVTATGSTNNGVKTSFGFSTGKYYMEFMIVEKGTIAIGICNENETLTSNSLSSRNQIIFYYNGNVFPSNMAGGLSGFSNGSVLQIKIDADNKTMAFGLNGTWSSNTFTLTGNEFFPVVRNFGSSDSTTVQANFGQENFAYDIPEGYIGYLASSSAPTMIWDASTANTNVVINADNPLLVSVSSSSFNGVKTNIPLGSGKFYMEFTVVNQQGGFIGICNENFDTQIWSGNDWTSSNQISFYFSGGNVYPSMTSSGIGGVNTGDVVGVKVDTINKLLSFAVNNNWTQDFAIPTGTTFYPLAMNGSSSSTSTILANFGATPFTYDVPEGFTKPDSGEGTVTGSLLLKANDKYYSIKESNYDTSAQQYTEVTISDLATDIETYGFNNVEELITEVTMGSETFKPIDKFDSFQIISIKEKANVAIQGRKSDTELVVGSSSFNSNIASNIDYFKATANTDNNAHIKMAVSIDDGITWKTTENNGLTWTDLTCTIPLKEYAELTSEELGAWNTAKTEIKENGFDSTVIELIDFNTLKADSIIFAYVLYQDTYNSACDNLSLTWQFDSKGTMVKMSEAECKVALSDNKVVVTPTSNQSMMKINILNGLVDMGGGGSANFESATSTDIQNILSKGW